MNNWCQVPICTSQGAEVDRGRIGGRLAGQALQPAAQIFVVLAGRAVATVAGCEQPVEAGEALIVPAGETFDLANPYDEPFEAVAVMPVGGRATIPGDEPFVPPWAE